MLVSRLPILLVIVVWAACAQSLPTVASTPMATPAPMDSVPADVQFMRGMIMHHGQAIEMAHLVPDRTTNQAIRLLAERIDISQVEEIGRMKLWLGARADSMSGMHEMLMPGMLTPAQMQQLRDARGSAFDKLFLQDMIQHHEGAITMVAQLFADRGSVHDPMLFQMATSFDADQRAEIARMRAMLSNLQ